MDVQITQVGSYVNTKTNTLRLLLRLRSWDLNIFRNFLKIFILVMFDFFIVGH